VVYKEIEYESDKPKNIDGNYVPAFKEGQGINILRNHQLTSMHEEEENLDLSDEESREPAQ